MSENYTLEFLFYRLLLFLIYRLFGEKKTFISFIHLFLCVSSVFVRFITISNIIFRSQNEKVVYHSMVQNKNFLNLDFRIFDLSSASDFNHRRITINKETGA